MQSILLDFTSDAYQGLRLPELLTKAGFSVHVFAGKDSYLLKSIYPQQAYLDLAPINNETPAQVDNRRLNFIRLVLRLKPHVIIPIKDVERVECSQIYEFAMSSTHLSHEQKHVWQQIWDQSFAPQDLCVVLNTRLAFMNVCQQLSITTPSFVNLQDELAVKQLQDTQSDIILKLDNSTGGSNVMRVNSIEDLTHQRSFWQGKSGIAQSFVKGSVGCHAFSALKGRYLTGISAMTVKTLHHHFSQSSVLCSVVNEQVNEFAERFVTAVQYSGFGSIDFIIQADGRVVFIEFNQRLTKLTTFGDFFGADPILAYANALNGLPFEPAPYKENVSVSCFPYEWLINHKSSYITPYLQDIPWSEPFILQAIIDKKLNA